MRRASFLGCSSGAAARTRQSRADSTGCARVAYWPLVGGCFDRGGAVSGTKTAEVARRFRKKPVVIEAMQWTGDNIGEATKFLAEATAAIPIVPMGSNKPYYHGISIKTLEGRMMAMPGDWIIKGIKGEFYPCKPDIFVATYEEIDALVPSAAAPSPAGDANKT